jgi:hypothetical protein
MGGPAGPLISSAPKKDDTALNLSIELGGDGDMKVKMNGNNS